MNTSTVKVREVVPDFDLIHLPLPMQPTIVNIYLIDGGSEWALFDTEMHTGESVAAFREALDLIGLGKIICTHHHPDHFGTSSHYRELTRAPIYLHLLEAELAEFYTRSELRPESIRFSLKTEFRARPWETSRARERSFGSVYRPINPDIALADGDTIPIGSREVEIVWTPGHSPGHCVMLFRREGS